MNFGLMNKTWSESLTNTKILLLANSVLAVIILMMLAHQNSLRERVVLVPPHLSGKAEIDWDRADVGYYKEWGTYLSTLIGSINPRNVDFVTGAVMRLMDSSIATRVKDQLLEMANDPSQKVANVGNWYEVTQTIWERETQKVFVIGSLFTANGAQQPISKPTIYEYVFETRGGIPVVVNFDSYYDRYPHTTQWKASTLKSAALKGDGQAAHATQQQGQVGK